MDLNEGRFTLNFQGQQKIQLFFWNTFDTNLANEVNWALSWLQQEKLLKFRTQTRRGGQVK